MPFVIDPNSDYKNMVEENQFWISEGSVSNYSGTLLAIFGIEILVDPSAGRTSSLRVC